MATPKKRVVVVGGGVAGSLASKYLQDVADVTLIDPKDYFEVPYAALRCLVEPKMAERSVVNHSAYLTKARIEVSEAMDASEMEVMTSSGVAVPYDFLVICTGSTYTGPAKRSDRIIEYQKANRKLVEAPKLLIVGGGPVGVELAGEITVDFPQKKVTIVTASSRLLEFLSPKASAKTLKWLKKKKVDVIFEDKVDPESKDGHTYTTRKGRLIEAQLHFWCVGKRLGNSWIQNSIFNNWLDDNGRLKVDSTMRLVNCPNVFCAGDLTNIQEIKQGYLASLHAEVVAENIKKLIKDPNTNFKNLKTYTRMTTPGGIVSLGRRDALLQLPCGTFLGCLPGLVKNKDLFVGKSREGLGLGASC